MNTATIVSAATLGVDAYPVEVSVTIQNGLPSFSVTGVTHGAMREGRERIFPALANLGIPIPLKQITVNVAPESLPKQGSALDLAIAIGLAKLAKHSYLATMNTCIVGELGIEGDVRPVRGTLAMALAARANGLETIIVPQANVNEAAVVSGIHVIGVSTLRECIGYLAGEIPIEPTTIDTVKLLSERREDVVDFADVRAQAATKRAMEVAAAGGHNVLLIGPPGAGKTMLARRFPTILPDLTTREAIETTKVWSVAGLMANGQSISAVRPFRAPHHTISDAGLVGGGSNPRPGEVSLAHLGVLFLDELPEFRKNVLEVMMNPLQDGSVTLTRAAASVTYPSRFTLIAAMNPCPCGWHGDPVRKCRCGDGAEKYAARIERMLPFFDLILHLPAVAWQDLTNSEPGESSATIRGRVTQARLTQEARFFHTKMPHQVNAAMSANNLRRWCKLDEECEGLMRQTITHMGLSARSYHKVLKVARTIADLDGSEKLLPHHLREAVSYQRPIVLPVEA